MDTNTTPRNGTILRLENVSKTFGKGDSKVEALKNVNLEVHPGELMALVGPSGSGKSTLLSIAGALLSPTEGNIYLNGKDISGVDKAGRTDLRLDNIGFIFQTSNLVSFLRGRDQLMLIAELRGTDKDKAEKVADDLLDSLGMKKRGKHYPEEMSGGERQRIAIARALMNEPDLILADEPTASLDSTRARQVVELLGEQVHSRQKAGVLVTHDERLLDLCDRVVRIADGELAQDEKVTEGQAPIDPETGERPGSTESKPEQKRDRGWIGQIMDKVNS